MRMNRGDTIIEVMLAFTVFSMLAVGAIALMNKGVGAAQYSLESTLVRQQIDAQAEAIRYVRDAAMAGADSESVEYWNRMTSRSELAVEKASNFGASAANGCPAKPSTSVFFMDAHDATPLDSSNIKTSDDVNSTPYAQVIYDDPVRSSGIWVEAVRKNPTQKFVDFHIRACWYPPSSSAPATMGTIVRLAVLS